MHVFTVVPCAPCIRAVSRCDPPVPGLPALVEQLNTSNQFSDFIKALRAEWQAMVDSSSRIGQAVS